MVTELREYRIARGSLNRFVDEWRSGIAPIRRQVGFTIEGAWTVDGESRFVWLLSHPGDWKAYDKADAAYHDSPERAALDPDPARLIEGQQTSRLVEVRVEP